MKKREYEHLIYYTICEKLFEEHKKTNFLTLNNMCKTIKTNITNGLALSTEEYKVLSKTMSEITYLYGLDDNDMVNLVNHFFKSELWDSYIDIVVIFKSKLKFSYQ